MTLGPVALKIFDHVERIIVIALLVMLVVVVLVATWTFGGLLAERIAISLRGGVAYDEQWGVSFHQRMNFLREIFSGFLLLLIGIELMKTVVMYLSSHVLHVEVVLTVAMIAIARHTIDLDLEHSDPFLLMGIGVMILALSIGYYYFRRATEAGGESGAEGRKETIRRSEGE